MLFGPNQLATWIHLFEKLNLSLKKKECAYHGFSVPASFQFQNVTLFVGNWSSNIVSISSRIFWRCLYWTNAISIIIKDETLSGNYTANWIAVLPPRLWPVKMILCCPLPSKQETTSPFPDNTLNPQEATTMIPCVPTYRSKSIFQTSVQNCTNFCLNKIIHAVLPYPGRNFQLDRSIALMPSDRTGGSYFMSNLLQKIDQRRGNFSRHYNITIQQIAQSNPSTSF